MENADAGKYAHPGRRYALVQSESFQHLPCLNLQCHAQWLSHLSSKLLHSQYTMFLSSAPAWWENLSLVSSPFHHLHHTLCLCEYYPECSKRTIFLSARAMRPPLGCLATGKAVHGKQQSNGNRKKP